VPRRNYASLLKEGISSPGKAPTYIKRNALNPYYSIKYERYRRKNNIRKQKLLLDEFLNKKEYVIIVLDACRYDYFYSLYSNYLEGNLEKVWSSGNRTPQWVPRTWDKKYDLTYISASSYPVTTKSWNHLRESFNPNRKFRDTIPVFEKDEIISTVAPEIVTDVALKYLSNVNNPRAVVHYLQPHSPYIGSTKLLPWYLNEDQCKSALNKEKDIKKLNKTINGYAVHDIFNNGLDYNESKLKKIIPKLEKYNPKHQVADGLVTDAMYKQAYEDNLKCVFSEVTRLVQYLDCDIIITSDHGEHLGDHLDVLWEYNHPRRTHPVLREVPWFVVSENSKGKMNVKDLNTDHLEYGQSHFEQEEIDQHLEALGYL